MLTLEKTASFTAAPVFSDVDRLEKAGIRMARRDYRPGQMVFMTGDTADRLYLLVKGMVRVFKDYGDYRQATVVLLKDNGGFGELDFHGGVQRASAQAMTGCRVASIRKSDLKSAMERRPALAGELFSVFSEKLRRSEQMMEMLLHRGVAARLASLIPVLAEGFGGGIGDDEGEAAGFAVPLTHGELAEMVACSREAVSKALGELRDEGFIELGRRKIIIMDQGGLKEHAARTGAPSIPRQVAGLPRAG